MNPFFGVMGGGRPNMMQQFQQFMNQMKGTDPNAMIQEMVSSGRMPPQHDAAVPAVYEPDEGDGPQRHDTRDGIIWPHFPRSA
nr:MAG TPA: hypothetical protein [Caudoviricetes sp.]